MGNQYYFITEVLFYPKDDQLNNYQFNCEG